MNTKRLDKLISQLDQQAQRAFDAYQETGTQRYYTKYNNATEQADFLRIARASAEEHAELIALRGTLAYLAMRFAAAHDGDYDRLVKDLLAYAAGQGLYQPQDLPAAQDNIGGGEQ